MRRENAELEEFTGFSCSHSDTVERACALGVRRKVILFLSLPFISCVALRKLFNSSEAQVPTWQSRTGRLAGLL